MPNENPYSTHTVARDIVINGVLAFSKGERVTVPGFLPGGLRAGDTTIIFSAKLNQQVQMRASDLIEITPEHGKTKRLGHRGVRRGVMHYVYILIFLAVLVGIGYGVFLWLFDHVVNNTGYMEPAIRNGEKVWVERFTFKIDEPDTGDIVQIAYPFDSKDPDQFVILRVIAREGDRLRISTGRVSINDFDLTEEYATLDSYNMQEITIPEGQVFVMGDQRAQSIDSRNWGLVPTSAIRGKVME